MNPTHLADMEFSYTSLERVDYEHGGQFYGTMAACHMSGGRLRSHRRRGHSASFGIPERSPGECLHPARFDPLTR